MATNNPYKNPDNEKKGGLTPVIPGFQPQYDQPLRRPSSSSASSTSQRADPDTTTTTTKPTVAQTEQQQPMPLNTQPSPSDQYTHPAPQHSLPQQQTNTTPLNLQPGHNQESPSQPILLTQQHTPSQQQQQPPSYASSQEQQGQPPSVTATPEEDPFHLSEQKVASSSGPSPNAQKMNDKLQDRYRLKEESQAQTFSPRQEHAQRYQDISAEHLVQNPAGDPALDKLKSGFWKRAGQVQAALGNLSGMEQWQDQGRTNEAWADTAYREAESRQRLGEASWLNGEYNVVMGKLTNALGYVAGDPEMQAKARLRAHEGQQEIERLKR